MEQLFQQKYQILEPLGKGGFGQVVEAKDLLSNEHVAIKIDIKRKGPCLKEAQILRQITPAKGFSQVLESGSSGNFTYLVLELLGPNINQAMRQQGRGLDPGSIADLGIQCISRVQHLHSFGFVHRDIKPQQFLLGKGEIVYLVDFGLTERWQEDGKHIKRQQRCSRAGNSSFSSLNNHLGVRQSRRDDLESIGYMLVYLQKGRLPWQMPREKNSKVKWQKVYNVKSQLTLLELCQNCPSEFSHFISYARTLSYEQEPDYLYLKSLLQSVRRKCQSNFQKIFAQYNLHSSKFTDYKRRIILNCKREQGMQLGTIRKEESKTLDFTDNKSMSDTQDQTKQRDRQQRNRLLNQTKMRYRTFTPNIRLDDTKDWKRKRLRETSPNKNCTVF